MLFNDFIIVFGFSKLTIAKLTNLVRLLISWTMEPKRCQKRHTLSKKVIEMSQGILENTTWGTGSTEWRKKRFKGNII